MNCLVDGKNSASSYFRTLSGLDTNKSEMYRLISDAFFQCSQAIGEMRKLYSNDMDEAIKKLADPTVRKQTCDLCQIAKQASILECLNRVPK